MPEPVIGDQEIKQIILLKKQGLSFDRIAEKLYIGRRTIFTALKKRGIKVANKPVLNQRQVNRILVLKSHGLSNRLIAQRMGVHRKNVDAVVRGQYNPIHIENGYDSFANQCD